MINSKSMTNRNLWCKDHSIQFDNANDNVIKLNQQISNINNKY